MHSRIGIAISVGSYQACATDVASRAVGLRGRLRLVRRIRPHAVKIDRFGNPEGARVAVSTVEDSCLRAFCQVGKPVREESGGRGLPNRFDFTARARFSRHEARGAVAQWGGVAWEPGIRAENRGSGAVWGHRACASSRAPGPSRSRVGPRARPLAFARWSARPVPHVRPSRTPAPLRASHTPLAPLALALDPRPGGLILVYQFALESCQTLLSFIGWYASFKTPHFCAYAQIVGDATA